MIENEFKIILTSEQYEKLLSLYDWDKTVVQTNHYYDTDDFRLSNTHITCRVREIDGAYFLQMKFPAARTYSRVELEKPLNALPETLAADELFKTDNHDELPDVERLGALTTTRSVKLFDGAEIDLDKSEYFGKTDFELEIEFTDETTARQLLAEITDKLNIQPNSEVCMGKIRRFLEEYARQK
ncbi:MAG: CYTH domain-containing protein [Oscillospiraceae bacterium]|nr:CYTH domain-containing protein [Oscillospiraceae bacterium]